MGRGRPKKQRSPPPPESLTLPVGAEAEMRSADPGFLGSFYEVTITGHLVSSGRYTVVYSTLLGDDGRLLEETAAAADVRPRPPPFAGRGFAVHDTVEALHNEGWWAGVVSAVPRPGVYEVAFPTSREKMEFEETALRPHCVFQAGRWVPAAEVALDVGSALFTEGTQVEVSRSGKGFGESWIPASVLKVIGGTNFLVQYMHIVSTGELATEILAAQYIRPAHTFRRYRFSRSSHVEVMHEDSWWPGVIQDFLGSGIDKKYVVKLKSYETHMDDVECLDVLTVENTHIRPKFHWDGKKWLRCLEEKSANVPTSASRKRPVSCALSFYKEVGETSGERGSYRRKKLKNADVVSEKIPSISSVCTESYKIKCKSSSYPEETTKQGNAVLAPPSLPPTAGFSHLSGSSLAQSSHLEQATSQKFIIPSAPVAVPQSQQLQASLFGAFGQPRALPQGPLFGMRSLNPETPKEVIAAKSIEEATNSVSMSEDPGRPKNGDDSAEPHYPVAAGCGVPSDKNKVSCADPATSTQKDIAGSQHAVSQQARGSAMDSESSAIQQYLPFGKTSPFWARVEAMEIFGEMPQRPHANQFRQYGPELREGMALGLMLSFADLAESIGRLDVYEDDIVQEKVQGLSLLEENGFAVGALRSRLETLIRKT
uniref:Uncharacterized protein n=1 Tax=Avena sativa TaxID=4498 RepID=A0ACD5ZYL3_AVESA